MSYGWQVSLSLKRGGYVMMPTVQIQDRAQAEQVAVEQAHIAGYDVTGIFESRKVATDVSLGTSRDWWK